MLETTSNQSPQTTTVPHLENAVMFLNDIIHLQDTHTLAVCIHLKPGGKKKHIQGMAQKGSMDDGFRNNFVLGNSRNGFGFLVGNA